MTKRHHTRWVRVKDKGGDTPLDPDSRSAYGNDLRDVVAPFRMTHPQIAGPDLGWMALGLREAAVFSKRCASCHSGPTYSDHLAHDVGTGTKMITPSLVGASSRSAFLHDGCAGSLRAVFGSCGGGGTGHAGMAQLDLATQDDLLAFLRSL